VLCTIPIEIYPLHLCAYPKPVPGFQTLYVMVFYMFNDLRSEVIVHFVHHHCLKFLCIFFFNHSPMDMCYFIKTEFPSTISHWHFKQSLFLIRHHCIFHHNIMKHSYFTLLKLYHEFTCTPRNSCSSEKRNPIRSSIFIFLDNCLVYIETQAITMSHSCHERQYLNFFFTGLTPLNCCAYPKPGSGFQTLYHLKVYKKLLEYIYYIKQWWYNLHYKNQSALYNTYWNISIDNDINKEIWDQSELTIINFLF
jgi:hypothetical protein